MADHQRPSEDLLVKPAEESAAEPGNSFHHSGWECTARVSMTNWYRTFGPTFSTSDDAVARRFEPFPKDSGFGDTWCRSFHFTPYQNNFIYLCAGMPQKVWNPHNSTLSDHDHYVKGLPAVVQSYFHTFQFYRVKSIWWTMSN